MRIILYSYSKHIRGIDNLPLGVWEWSKAVVLKLAFADVIINIVNLKKP